ncbi:hypothetical protein A2Y85_03275 [candidate division WOR-3 bacterium RBG_13_43_14]|uniref:Nudix hydrolase domain-containing protein n=1 Tax=candidate division WOR-3 bacterium RBG_13_43_14 TaxID=1802590 RepID=A0A1F4UE90_UNCW3|nr:MAG: hypothetical protein A2Y85_03275 [candidate division WOR-3 bacterium RBG_13_43_14]
MSDDLTGLAPAVAVVIKQNGKYLVIKRAKTTAENYWCPITGAVEPGESQAQAVIRESKEEMGVEVEPIQKIWECPTENKKYLLHWWLAKLITGEFKSAPDEVKDYKWLTAAEFSDLKLTFEADRYFFSNIAGNISDSI